MPVIKVPETDSDGGGVPITTTFTEGPPAIPILTISPPEGALHQAPFGIVQGGATFDGEWDPVWYFGYNPNRTVATEPTFRWAIEGNYFHGGVRDIEAYWEWMDTVAAGGGVWRPIFLYRNKASVVGTAGTGLNFNADGFQFKATRVVPVTVSFAVTGAAQGADIGVVGDGGTATNLNNYLSLSGGRPLSAGQAGGYLKLYGNEYPFDDGVATRRGKGIVYLAAGNVATPTGRSGSIELLTGETLTERLSVDPIGRITTGANGPGGLGTSSSLTKQLTGVSTATALFTFTVPNAAHGAMARIDVVGVATDGSVGQAQSYNVILTRASGAATALVVSTAYGTATSGAGTTAIAAGTLTGANNASQTYTVTVALGAAGTVTATCTLLNNNATGITVS